jgi:hypothetical protein
MLKGDHQRTPVQKEYDLRDIIAMKLKKFTAMETMEFINRTRPYKITIRTIYREIRRARDEWRKERMYLLSDHRDEELAAINAIEKEAWEAYKRSTTDRITTVGVTEKSDGTGKIKDPKKITIKTEKQHGDAYLLKIIHDCSVARRNLMGLDEPKKASIENAAGKPFMIEGKMTLEQAIGSMSADDITKELSRMEAEEATPGEPTP